MKDNTCSLSMTITVSGKAKVLYSREHSQRLTIMSETMQKSLTLVDLKQKVQVPGCVAVVAWFMN